MTQLLKNYLLKIQVFQTSRIDERSGVSEKTGKEWHIRTQEAYIDLGGQFPVQVKVRLEKDQLPYAPGFYVVHPQSFKTNAYSELQITDLVLVPVDAKDIA